jgi:hypothetical protein
MQSGNIVWFFFDSRMHFYVPIYSKDGTKMGNIVKAELAAI